MDSTPPMVALIDFPGHDDTRQRLAFGPALRWLVADREDQVANVIDEAHGLAQQGHWCVGWISFEAAPAFDACLPTHPAAPGQPLAVFAVFEHAQPWPTGASDPWQTAPWQSILSPQVFEKQIHAIHEWIKAGEVYQVNLTSPLFSQLGPDTPNTPLAYFRALQRSQPQGYAAYLDTTPLTTRAEGYAGPSHVLSASPELFFQWQSGLITTRPMKGTAARGTNPQADADAAKHLQTSDKERAENLMIVDLLRNDLSRIAQVGSVQVPSLFDVQALPTVWQMTSTVQARTLPGLTLSEVFGALFPCGSITGAPKRRAMHHIAALEGAPRGVYCGAMGLLAPGGDATFNVPIRTVELYKQEPTDCRTWVGNIQPHPSKSDHLRGWQARCGVGSGITLDATVEAEALEWQHKQAFLKRAARPFEILESLRLEEGQIPRREAHLQRMARSAVHFAFPLDAVRAQQALAEQCLRLPIGIHKIRLRLDERGQVRCESNPLSDSQQPIRVTLAHCAMPAADEFIAHKTTQRSVYDSFAPQVGCFDTLLWNARGELCEFTIGNVAVLLEGQWLTPPLSCGLLPGVMRATLLAEGRLTEHLVTLADLHKAQAVALINSVRGWLTVDHEHLLSQPWPDLP